jgi:hypothetical protein
MILDGFNINRIMHLGMMIPLVNFAAVGGFANACF